MNNSTALSPELVSLVHHIELNKEGWWEQAMGRLVLTALWAGRDRVALTVDDIVATLSGDFRMAVDTAVVRRHAEALSAAGRLLHLTDGRYKLSEDELDNCERALVQSAELEARVKQRFQQLSAEICPSLDPIQLWSSLHSEFLLPTVSQMGANTYHLITGGGIDFEMPLLRGFIDSSGPSKEVELHRLVGDFLNPTNSDVRKYVLRLMNAHFVVRAGGLNGETIKRLVRSASQLPDTVLFFDTNVLFSLLGLHDNPADEGSLALVNLVRQIDKEMPIRLRVLLPTLDEMKKAITASQETVLNMRISPQLIDKAAGSGISGITEKFLRLAAGRDTRVSPADYFEPYLNNLLTILRGKGVEIFSQDLRGYGKRQDVIDDLLQQLEFERAKYGERAKNYERLEHDMVLWHLVKDKRPVRVESPVDAAYWIVTADYRLLGFDAHKQQQNSTAVPICLHPTTLTQLLQLWVPQTDEFEQALLSTMRLPTVLAAQDSDAERVSLRILNALSTFENIGDLPPDTTTRILLNDALRQKLKVEDDISKQVELVREALVEDNKRFEASLEEERNRALQLEKKQDGLATQLSCAAEKVESLEKTLKDQQKVAAEKQKDIESLETRLACAEEDAHRGRFIWVWASILVAVCLLVTVGLRRIGIQSKFIVLADAAVVILWLLAAEYAGGRTPAVAVWRPYLFLQRIRIAVYSVVLAPAIGNAAWDWLKAVLKN